MLAVAVVVVTGAAAGIAAVMTRLITITILKISIRMMANVSTALASAK